jgi:hypothetical protein
MDMNMTRIIAIMACGLSLAACSSWSPSFSWAPSLDSFKSKPASTNLTVESDPPGAEARTSQGLTCRTPCTLAVPVAEEFSVSYALNGYAPQSVPVHPVTATGSPFSLDGASGTAATIEPNPVFVQLSPTAPPPKPPAPPKKKKRPIAPATAAAPAAPPPVQSKNSAFPPPPGAFTPNR